MNELQSRIEAAIRANGPMPVSLYMLMCLHDPQHGYYATRPRFNRDFTTAPETSQVFGELLGLWAADAWRSMGAPAVLQLVELGPGRGVMMADMLRAARAVPGFAQALQINFIEASPVLRREQEQHVAGWPVAWRETLADVPDGPAILIGNEFLDCMAVHQAVRTPSGWRARQVGLASDGGLRFGLGPPAAFPDDVQAVQDEVEWAPSLDMLVANIADRFSRSDGRALFIDYGPAKETPGDTLRAYREGRQVDPLSAPGECDLTADVDFGRLNRLAIQAGLSVAGPVTQHDFLLRLGARERTDRLAASNPAKGESLRAALDKLVSPAEMGTRFKAICLAPSGAPSAAGFE